MLRYGLRMAALSLIAIASAAHAAMEEMPDEDLSLVSAEDGLSIILHFEWASRLTDIDLGRSSAITFGFYDDDAKRHTSLVFQGFGGIMDLWGLRIDARTGSVGDYVDITMPTFVYFRDFGFRALYAESYTGSTPPATPTEPPGSYGKWLLNGAATMTGSVYLWPAK